MEENIERLKTSVKTNQNFTSDDFKESVFLLIDSLVHTYPQFNYYNLSNALSSLSINIDNNLGAYSIYDRENNRLSVNVDKILEDRIDMQHLFMSDMLNMQSNVNSDYEAFGKGLNETICMTINSDESMKKLNVQEYILASIFSKIVDADVLLDACFNSRISSVLMYLDTLGIGKEEFDNLSNCFTNLKVDGMAFANAETIMIDMFNKKINVKGEKEGEIDSFKELLITSRNDLISMYPYHNFSNLIGFEDVKRKVGEIGLKEIEEEKTR